MTSLEGFSNYVIFENGDIISLKRGIMIKPQLSKKGYKRVELWNDNGKGKHMSVHRLVALAHIPNPLNKPMVDHIDENKLNNNVENLRWATNSENQLNISKPKIDNKLGEKNIYIQKDGKNSYYKFQKTIEGKRHYKYFKTLEDAIKYRDEYLK